MEITSAEQLIQESNEDAATYKKECEENGIIYSPAYQVGYLMQCLRSLEADYKHEIERIKNGI